MFDIRFESNQTANVFSSQQPVLGVTRISELDAAEEWLKEVTTSYEVNTGAVSRRKRLSLRSN